jgi:hypothetical protein
MNTPTTSPVEKQLIATLPFRSQQIGDAEANYDVSVWKGDLVCEKRTFSPCDTSGLFYGSAEDEVTKFCPRHFYEMHGGPGPTYRLIDPPTHSRGPWMVMVSPGDTLYVENGRRRIADLWADGITPEENAANARLLALSPELHDALLAVFSLFRTEIESDENEDISGADFLDAFLEWRSDFKNVLDKLERRA